ncbi:hypothetical protein L6452_16461 [Arctium lappa]|uniref:Uncharacterized protein n=1 Tax=Arctium lappa TaxID=4217 RepID=A0ACB9C0Q1_ARCLA|nr:hypothetical protein L6452_16461 [Arctium lappa]
MKKFNFRRYEIEFDPSVTCERLEKSASFSSIQIEDGKVICFQKLHQTLDVEYVKNRQIGLQKLFLRTMVLGLKSMTMFACNSFSRSNIVADGLVILTLFKE